MRTCLYGECDFIPKEVRRIIDNRAVSKLNKEGELSRGKRGGAMGGEGTQRNGRKERMSP